MKPSTQVAVLALGAAILLPFSDAMVKWLARDYSVLMIAWARMGVIAILLGMLGARELGVTILRPRAWRMQLLRGLAAVFGTVMVFRGFQTMALADCTAIVFLAPVLANLMSQYGLDERGDPFSWTVALVSFAGVLAIARPSGAMLAPVALYPLAGAFGLALFLVLTRALATHDHPRVTAFYGPMVAFLVFTCMLPWVWRAPASGGDIAMFVAIGILAAGAQWMQVMAYRIGTTHRVAPFGYLSIAVAGLIGWIAFGHIPDLWSVSGMLLIALAGLAMILRA